jgi:hypothetical protein
MMGQTGAFAIVHLPPSRSVAGQGDAVPVLVVQLDEVAAVAAARPASLLAEQRVAPDGLGGEQPVPELPGALQLAQDLGADVGAVLLRNAYGCFGVLYSASFWSGFQMVS